MDDQFIIPAPRGSEGYVELARSAKAPGFLGAHFRKHILNLGPLIHPKTGERINLDDSFYDTLQRNFQSGVCDTVAVPLANDKNEHTEYPLDNTGEVMGISREGSKVYLDLDVRRPEVAQGLRDRTLLGASAFLHMNYKDTATGRKVGPTLLHSCITNRPYVTGLEPYEEVIAATSDGTGDVIVLGSDQEESPEMDKAELLAKLKAEHGVDVEALQAAALDRTELTAALTAALSGAGSDQMLLTGANGETVGLSDVVGAVAELAHQVQGLSTDNENLRLTNATEEIDRYVSEGRVLPRQRDDFIQMAMTDRPRMERLLPDEPVIKLNNVSGHGGEPQGSQRHKQDLDAELMRLTDPQGQYAHMFGKRPR